MMWSAGRVACQHQRWEKCELSTYPSTELTQQSHWQWSWVEINRNPKCPKTLFPVFLKTNSDLKSRVFRVEAGFTDLSNPVFFFKGQRFFIAKASQLLTSRAEAGLLKLHQLLPCGTASLLFFSSKPLLFLCLLCDFTYSIQSLVPHPVIGIRW